MFWIVFLTTGFIIILEWIPLIKKKNKEWNTIILMAILLFIGNFLTIIFYYELIELPSIAGSLNDMFKALIPAFFKFMDT